jgi:hypothetical protein
VFLQSFLKGAPYFESGFALREKVVDLLIIALVL